MTTERRKPYSQPGIPIPAPFDDLERENHPLFRPNPPALKKIQTYLEIREDNTIQDHGFLMEDGKAAVKTLDGYKTNKSTSDREDHTVSD